jgi:trehalose 6-phosphate synthase/phosphatase
MHYIQEFPQQTTSGQVSALPFRDASDDLSERLSAALRRAGGPLHLLIDYDGTLVPYKSTPDEAAPDAGLLRLLGALAVDPRIAVHIVSGRSIHSIDCWFRELCVDLWAEHGAGHRPSEGGAWQYLVDGTGDWFERAATFLEEVTRETPGSLLERKTTCIAWHYRLVEPHRATEQLARMRHELPKLLGAAVELFEGRMVLEIRKRGVSKGMAVRHILENVPSRGPIVAIGDDRTDEEMFLALPPSGVAIRVGDGSTRARYSLADFRAVRRLLERLLEAPGTGGETKELR